jgi:hypothetical protein
MHGEQVPPETKRWAGWPLTGTPSKPGTIVDSRQSLMAAGPVITDLPGGFVMAANLESASDAWSPTFVV